MLVAKHRGEERGEEIVMERHGLDADWSGRAISSAGRAFYEAKQEREAPIGATLGKNQL
jgi:hypothetical protein